VNDRTDRLAAIVNGWMDAWDRQCEAYAPGDNAYDSVGEFVADTKVLAQQVVLPSDTALCGFLNADMEFVPLHDGHNDARGMTPVFRYQGG
jgi:hypothetical protein